MHIGVVTQGPHGSQNIIGVAFWKIKNLAAQILAIESQQEFDAMQERQTKIVAPEQVRRDWKRILSGKGK